MKVTPIPFERMTFKVESEVVGREPYRVDLEWNNGIGGCDCDDYEKRTKERKKLTCKHIREARRYYDLQTLQ